MIALAIAAGCGASAAFATAEHRGSKGTIVGHVRFGSRRGSGVMKVFTATGRVVAHRDLRWGHSHFRFVLRPGRLRLKLNFTDGFACGPYNATVRVRANRTTRVGWAEACGTY
ncbi:MAG TPA: hypothetical protein VGF70_13600 [Solirubrobacteraceae bacterium]|jgi:hypothetical protein